jgi:osmotically-inducible protein OsmY
MKRTSAHPDTATSPLRWLLSLGAAALILSGTGCTTGNRYQQSTGEYIDDHGLSSAVKKSLGNDVRFKYPDVNVATFKGVIQLSGFAATREQKDRAGELAMAVPGVKAVVNNITIKE